MKYKFLLSFAVFIFIFIAITSAVSAHPGRTDGNGGHTDHSTGVYHYHHGYEAHQHINGTCPFYFDDKTGQSSGSSSGSKEASPEVAAVQEESEPSVLRKIVNWLGDAVLFLILLFTAVYLLSMIFSIIVAIFTSKK